MRVILAEDQGRRQYMEDTNAHKISDNLGIFGVFDGHNGREVADICRVYATTYVQNEFQKHGSATKALETAFALLDRHAKLSAPVDCGSTAIMATLTRDGQLTVANAGDSLGILLTRNGIVNMSEDHKVEYEKERILKAGGRVTYDDGVARINRLLNVSRSIGDHHLKKYVPSTPFVAHLPWRVQSGDVLVLATDGIWDVFGFQELGTIVFRAHDRAETAKRIICEARRRMSGDNATLMILEI
jgi:serine/threonine protein phosphatase PrpC